MSPIHTSPILDNKSGYAREEQKLTTYLLVTGLLIPPATTSPLTAPDILLPTWQETQKEGLHNRLKGEGRVGKIR